MDVLLMAASFVLIVAGAIGFTNAVEWLGHRLDLGGGATGAILAAIGTALPESTIPVLALIGGGEEAEEIAIGSIIGAPFLLGTLAMVMIGGAAMAFRGRDERPQGREIDAEQRTALRDLAFFAGGFTIALTLGVLDAPKAVRVVGAVLLVVAYLLYAYRTIAVSRGESGDEDELDPLFFDTSKADAPNTGQIVLQFVVSLAAIIAGAEMFVQVVENVAESLGVETLVLALILAPLATELPEKANSILWVRRGKDTLAIGNVSGAMTFQATLPVAIGLVATPWDLSGPAFVAGACGLAGGLVAMLAIRSRRFGLAACAAWGALLTFGIGYAVLS